MTMPTITNVSSFTVTVRATKVGYKTISITKTISVALNINAFKIGDYVNYKYDSAGSYTIKPQDIAETLVTVQYLKQQD